MRVSRWGRTGAVARRGLPGVCGAVALAAFAPGVAQAAPGPVTFTYTGAEQSYVVPAGVTSVKVDAVGGQEAARTTT